MHQLLVRAQLLLLMLVPVLALALLLRTLLECLLRQADPRIVCRLKRQLQPKQACRMQRSWTKQHPELLVVHQQLMELPVMMGVSHSWTHPGSFGPCCFQRWMTAPLAIEGVLAIRLRPWLMMMWNLSWTPVWTAKVATRLMSRSNLSSSALLPPPRHLDSLMASSAGSREQLVQLSHCQLREQLRGPFLTKTLLPLSERRLRQQRIQLPIPTTVGPQLGQPWWLPVLQRSMWIERILILPLRDLLLQLVQQLVISPVPVPVLEMERAMDESRSARKMNSKTLPMTICEACLMRAR